jgi:hypothetical protein
MDEDSFRKCVVVLLALFVIGSMVVGFRMAENGRYVQYDISKSALPDGTMVPQCENLFFDTRTGEVIENVRPVVRDMP